MEWALFSVYWFHMGLLIWTAFFSAHGDGKFCFVIFSKYTYWTSSRGYIVFGAATVLIGIITFFFLVDDVDSKILRLTDKEKDIVQERSRDNCVVRNKKIKKEHMVEALKEPRLYLIFIAQLCNCLQNGGLITFSTLLIEGLGFSVSTNPLVIILSASSYINALLSLSLPLSFNFLAELPVVYSPWVLFCLLPNTKESHSLVFWWAASLSWVAFLWLPFQIRPN